LFAVKSSRADTLRSGGNLCCGKFGVDKAVGKLERCFDNALLLFFGSLFSVAEVKYGGQRAGETMKQVNWVSSWLWYDTIRGESSTRFSCGASDAFINANEERARWHYWLAVLVVDQIVNERARK
jgi:hypothetical protein